MRLSQQVSFLFIIGIFTSCSHGRGSPVTGVCNKYDDGINPLFVINLPRPAKRGVGNRCRQDIGTLSSRCTHATLTVSYITTQISGIIEDIPILFENSSLLAINKPHGISYHDDPVAGSLGIVSLLRSQRLRQNKCQHMNSSEEQERLYGVHRLDRVTSGILLFAKSPRVASMLMAKFANNGSGRDQKDDGIVKLYFGISGKKPAKKKQGWVNGIMVKGRRGGYKLLPPANKGNKNSYKDIICNDDNDDVGDDYEETPAKKSNYASTRFYTAGLGHLPQLASLPLSSSKDDVNAIDAKGGERNVGVLPRTAILFRPHTGKTHQLRVAAKSLGLPILGDARYGGGLSVMAESSSSSSSLLEDDICNIDRTYLHASAIHFTLDGENVTIWSPPPFANLISSSDNDRKDETTMLDEIFELMVEKYCDCQPIIDAVHATRDLRLA